ncbi:hypothetical protein Tco_0853046 [Tanacetum coccineum]
MAAAPTKRPPWADNLDDDDGDDGSGSGVVITVRRWGDGGDAWRRVEARDLLGWIDRATGSTFGFGRKSFPAAAIGGQRRGSGGRRWAAGNGRGERD